MRSHMPFADPASFDLRQHLADTAIDPAEMFGLASLYYTDPSAVAVLCEHAKGSFRLLVGLFAAQEHVMTLSVVAGMHDRNRFRDQVFACVTDQCRSATEADLLEGLRAARSVFGEGSIHTFRHGPRYVSDIFAAHAPVESLTGHTAAEMSVQHSWRLSPRLGHEPRRPRRASIRGVTYTPPSNWVVSRLLLSMFGEHVPSWDMFKHLHTPDIRIGDLADLVVEVEQRCWRSRR